jgi:hypothetical protein
MPSTKDDTAWIKLLLDKKRRGIPLTDREMNSLMIWQLQNKKNVDGNPYSNYEDWVRAFLTSQIDKKNKKDEENDNWFSSKMKASKKIMTDTFNSGKIFLNAENKTKQLMNTLNSLNALFIIINSQFEMSLKYYERALKFDYTKEKVSTLDQVFNFFSTTEKKKQRGIDRIWELCESTVSYQKFLLLCDFQEHQLRETTSHHH